MINTKAMVSVIVENGREDFFIRGKNFNTEKDRLKLINQIKNQYDKIINVGADISGYKRIDNQIYEPTPSKLIRDMRLANAC